MLFRSSAHFLSGLFVFLDIEPYELFVYFGNKALVSFIACRYFLPFYRLSFCFMISFDVQKFLSLTTSHLFMDSERYCYDLCALPTFSSKVL